ncbi:MAG: NAD(P)/FAD-dependent oxidoreductase [Acetobacteraceae bacterium]
MRPALIIGGGPAGATTAALLAGSGRRVTLVERAPEPTDKVCGDFLSTEAIALARTLGVDPATLGAEPITHVRLAHGHTLAEAALPFPALGFSRRRFDAALLQAAEDRGATVLRGHAVQRIRRDRDSVVAQLQRHPDLRAGTVFLATGKHDLRGHPRPGRGEGPVGVKFALRLAPGQHRQLCGAVELVLFPGGYAGLQVIEHGQAVLCLLADRHRLPVRSGSAQDWIEALRGACPHLAQRLGGADAGPARPLTIAGLPFGYRRPARATSPQLYPVGDQIAVIPSLSGDGVALAMHSGAAAAHAWLGGIPPAEHARAFGARIGRQMHLASAIHAACLSGAGQDMLARAVRRWPGLLRVAANWTRLVV